MAEQIDYQLGGAFLPDRPVRFGKQVRFETGPVNVLDRVEFNAEVSGNNEQHFLEVVGTLPSSPSAGPEGVTFNITSAGSVAQNQYAITSFLGAGYTGSANTFTHYLENSSAGTGTVFLTGGNFGTYASSYATTTGTNTAVHGDAEGGNINYGVVGQAVTAKNSATNIGGAFFGRNTGTTPIEIGVYAGLNNTIPTFTSAALVADNAAASAPIILARDNGTVVWSVQDGGSLQGKMGAKTLTESVATAFVRIACAQGARTGGFVKYTIEADDGTDFQVRTGLLPFAIVNKAGSETGAVATVSTATETVAVSSGTLTNTFTIASNAADTMDILAETASSLTQTTLRINYSVELYGNAVVTVTPL